MSRNLPFSSGDDLATESGKSVRFWSFLDNFQDLVANTCIFVVKLRVKMVEIVFFCQFFVHSFDLLFAVSVRPLLLHCVLLI